MAVMEVMEVMEVTAEAAGKLPASVRRPGLSSSPDHEALRP